MNREAVAANAAEGAVRWSKTLARLALAERLDSIAAWCDATEAENRKPLGCSVEPGCRPCSIIDARLECVAQVRALLAVES